MLKEIFSGLITDIQTEFPFIKKVDRYKAELEAISEWKATDTACFLHVMGFKPIAKGAGGKSLKWNLILKVYAGANLKHDKSALEITEDLLKYFDGTLITFTVSGLPFQLKSQVLDEGMEFNLYRTAFEAYSFLVSIHTDIAQDVPVMPDEVVLVSPANGYNQGIASNADFEWQTAVGADTYRFQIATNQTFTNVVYDQDRLRYLKLTVPEGMLQNDVQYYWRISGKNQWGYGDWSEVRSYKTETTIIISPLNPSEIGSCFFWGRSDTIVQSGGLISQMTDKSGSGNHLIQTTEANKLSIGTFLSKQTMYNNSNLWKQVYIQDTTQKFKLYNQIKSFLITLVPQKNDPVTAVRCPIARTNGSYGSEWSLQNANNSYPLLFCDGQTYVGIVIPILCNELMQFIITCNGSNVLTLWANGVKINSEYVTFQNVIPDGHSGNYFVLGSYYKNAATQGRWKGHILECAWWNKFLSDNEIISLWNYHKEYFGI